MTLAATFATAAAAPQPPPAYACIILDAGGVDSRWLLADPERCPAFHALSRTGVTFLRVAVTATDHEEAVERFVGTGAESILSAAARTTAPAQVWLLAPRAGRTARLAAKARFFAPDLRYEPFRDLVERYGLPEPLEPNDLREIEGIRAPYGPEATPKERELTLLLSGRGAVDHPDQVVLHRLFELLQERNPTCLVAVLQGADVAHHDVAAAKDVVRETDAHLGALFGMLSEEPYRNRSLLADISLLGRDEEHTPSGHGAKTEGCAVIVAPALRPGLVMQEPVSVEALRALVFHALGAGEAPAADKIPAGLLRK